MADATHRRATHDRGMAAEDRVATALHAHGWTILARRVRTPAGEIDMIAREGATLVFIEVKHRKRLDDAAYAVTPRQQMRIAQAAEIWLGDNPDQTHGPMRFDAILLAPGGRSRHIRNAFDASDLA